MIKKTKLIRYWRSSQNSSERLNNFSLEVCHPFYFFSFVFNFHEAIILSSCYFFSRQFDPIIFCRRGLFLCNKTAKKLPTFPHFAFSFQKSETPHCCETSLCVQSKSLEFSSRVCLPLKTAPAQHNIPPFKFLNFQFKIWNLETIPA